VAAYLAAQNAAGPAQPAPSEAPPAEDLAAAQPADEPPTEERILGLTDHPTDEPPTEERVLGVAEFGQSVDEPPTEERVLGVAEFESAADEPPAERVLGLGDYEHSADEPPTEERVLGVGEFESAADEPPPEERVLGVGDEQFYSAAESLAVVPVENRRFGVAVEDQLFGVPAEEPGEAAEVEAPATGQRGEAQVEDEDLTAEIAAVTEQDPDPEDEYYASSSSPFVPETRDIPPNGFSSLDPVGDLDYRIGDENFQDEILGDADWTADQLGEPEEPAAGEITAQIEAIQEVEPQADQPRADQPRADQFRADAFQETGEPTELPVVAVAEGLVAERPVKLVVPDEGGGAVAIPGLGVVGGGDGPRVEPPPGSIEEAMRAEVERPRPRPKESAAFKALHDWCRARTRIVPSGFTIQVQVLDPSAPSYRFDLEPPEVDDPQYGVELLTELLGDLWIAEAQSEQGGWLFARIDTAGRTMRVDRWYDSVPDWWDNPVEARLDVHGLVRRLNGRGPDWQPSYLEKLYTTAR
jgi:hypothetical protein